MLSITSNMRIYFARSIRPRHTELLFSTDVVNSPTVTDKQAVDRWLLDKESILSALKNPAIIGHRTACNYLIRLSKLNMAPEQINELRSDERFNNLIKLLETDLRDCQALAIISSIKALKTLGVEEQSYVVKNLENAFLWRTRTCQIKDLVLGFNFALGRQETDSQKTMFREICEALERRWVELKDGRLIAILLSNSSKLSPQLLSRLEDRIQDSVQEMPPGDLVNVLTTYGRIGRRSMPVLRSLGFHLAKNRSFLDIKQIADVLFAFNKLSFKEQDTLDRICSALEPLIPSNDNPAVVRSILTSLGQLRSNQPTVLDMICDWYNKRLDENLVKSKDISALLITLAYLNYSSFERDELFNRLNQTMDRTEILSLPRGDLVWLETVLSLVILNRATNEQVSSVLHPDFSNKFLDSPEVNYLGYKLLNINAAARLLQQDYQGPFLNLTERAELNGLSPAQSGPKTKFKKLVFETLSTLFPPPRFVREDVQTGMGLTLDAEVIVDSNAKSLQIDHYSPVAGSQKAARELPVGSHRVAIFVTSFQDSLIGGGMTGSTNLYLRLARRSGFTTLLIDHNTIDKTMKTVSRVQKLDVLVKQSIGKKTRTDIQ